MNVIGENIVWSTIDNGKTLVIEIDLTAPTRPSKTGKTEVIASSLGNKKIQLNEGRAPIFLGLNCYRYADRTG